MEYILLILIVGGFAVLYFKKSTTSESNWNELLVQLNDSVSPMSLFPMLHITVKALHNLKVEKSIEDILKNINKLSNHLNAYKDAHDSLGETISTAVNHYNKSSSEFKKIDKDVLKISGGNTQINFESELIEKPNLDE